MPPEEPPPGDADFDGLPDSWELQFGLNPHSSAAPDGALHDPDGDAVTNTEESARATHPRGFHKRYLAEGATSPLFDTRRSKSATCRVSAVSVSRPCFGGLGPGSVSDNGRSVDFRQRSAR